MKIYTKTGDSGQTGLWGGQRVSKDSLRVSAYGTADELNAVVGMACALLVPPHAAADSPVAAALHAPLTRVQQELFVLGADLATPGEGTRIERVHERLIETMEQEIDQFEQELEPLRQFILPGGTLVAAQLHLARTVCRRAERLVVTLSEHEPLNPVVIPYLNRLSDWFFVVARLANARANVADVPWQPVPPSDS